MILLACAQATGQCSCGMPESIRSALAMLSNLKTAFSATLLLFEAAVVVKVIRVGGFLLRQ